MNPNTTVTARGTSPEVLATIKENLRSEPRPEWLRVPEATRLFGIGKTALYELIAENKLRSTLLKQRRGALRGIRLISYDSLRDFIESAANNEGVAA